jgi:hypothetical protein
MIERSGDDITPTATTAAAQTRIAATESGEGAGAMGVPTGSLKNIARTMRR